MQIYILIAKTQAISNSCKNHSHLMYASHLKNNYVGHMRYSHLYDLKSHGRALIHNFWMIFVSTDHSTALNSPSVRIFVSVQEKEIDESNIQQEPFIKFLQIPVVSDISFQQVFTGFMLHQHMIICTYALALFCFFLLLMHCCISYKIPEKEVKEGICSWTVLSIGTPFDSSKYSMQPQKLHII